MIQNQNESINAMLWIYCLYSAAGNVPLTISQFNWAETTNVPVFDSSGINVSIKFYKAVIKKYNFRTKKCYKENFRQNSRKKYVPSRKQKVITR